MMKNSIFLFCITFFFISCEKIDCERLSEIKRDYECLLIISSINDINSTYNFDISGISLLTGNDTLYKEDNRWFCSFYKHMNIGDTIIKRKGELIFNIHKKDTIMSFNWECEGKVYK